MRGRCRLRRVGATGTAGSRHCVRDDTGGGVVQKRAGKPRPYRINFRISMAGGQIFPDNTKKMKITGVAAIRLSKRSNIPP